MSLLGLPSQRTANLLTVTSLPSRVLNDLQDAIVGLWSPSHTMILGPSRWRLRSGTGAENDCEWSLNAASVITADLSGMLPVGTVVSSVTWAYARSSATVTRYVKRRSVIAPSTVAIIASAADSSSSGTATPSNAIEYTIATGIAAWLRLEVSSSSATFYGAVIACQKLT